MSYLQFFDLLLKLCNQALFVLQPAVHLADIIITPKSHRKTLLIIQFNSKIELLLVRCKARNFRLNTVLPFLFSFFLLIFVPLF